METTDWIQLKLQFRSDTRAAKLLQACADRLSNCLLEEVPAIRSEFLGMASALDFDAAQRCRVCVSVWADLRAQEWEFRGSADSVYVRKPPADEGISDTERKERIRNQHLFERDNQLRIPSTRAFIREMERRRLTEHGWRSIFDLFRDGEELASSIELCLRGTTSEKECLSALKKVIQPYVQIAEPDSHCPHTGLRLLDVWRYFRHTWVTPYNSVPGRQIAILIRDAATPNHAVIGIAALGSSIVQMSTRDEWIGWSSKALISTLLNDPSAKWAKWVESSLDGLIANVYKADLIRLGKIRRASLKKPDLKTIDDLRQFARERKDKHHLSPEIADHKRSDIRWKQHAETNLFAGKRAEMLAKLLGVRLRLNEAGFHASKRGIVAALENPKGRRAIEILLRFVKGSHVGVNMLDITVCGAVQPYNAILGGKLVGMLLLSPEIRTYYAEKYGSSESIIASSMAGKAVVRKPSLVFLGTTSLYSLTSSQYNRISLPLELFGKEGAVKFENVGRTLGFGSYHLSKLTVRELQILLVQNKRRRVNSIFGEGVSPRLRKIRDGLDLAGLRSELLMKHGSPRIVYVVPLAENFKEVLLGMQHRPRYYIPDAPDSQSKIADFWHERWLLNRVKSHEVRDALRQHRTSAPITHGAQVALPSVPEEEPPLFASVQVIG